MAGGKHRILLVDDESTILKVVGKRLEAGGFEVLIAEDGFEALAKTLVEHPDLIVLDLMMPKMDGVQVCEELKKDPRCRGIPVVIFTGKGTDADANTCRKLGISAYVHKADGTANLLREIDRLLSKNPV